MDTFGYHEQYYHGEEGCLVPHCNFTRCGEYSIKCEGFDNLSACTLPSWQACVPKDPTISTEDIREESVLRLSRLPVEARE